MTLEGRVRKLERENRWMRRIGGLLLAAVAMVVLVAQGDPKRQKDLEVRSLTLKDDDGVIRATLSVDKLAAILRLYDKKGQALVRLDASGTGSTLRLDDPSTEARAVIGTAVGCATLDLGRGGTTMPRLGLIAAETEASVRAIGPGSERVATLGVTKDGAALFMADARGRPELLLGAKGNGHKSLAFMDDTGQSRLQIHASKSTAAFEIKDRAGTLRATLGSAGLRDPATGARTTTDESNLTLFDAKGERIWQAPR